MRFLLALPFLVCCASSAPADRVTTFDSVRDRLANEPTRLLAEAAGSTGTLTASRYGMDGWQPGTAAFSIANGDLVATADAAGQLGLIELGATVDPIEIPQDVFGKPARLQDLRVRLASQATAMTTWTDADDATATALIDVDVSWSIALGDTVLPLATQHLQDLPAEVSITGGGDHVDATLSLHASGELWSWAGLVKLTDLQLTLATATVD